MNWRIGRRLLFSLLLALPLPLAAAAEVRAFILAGQSNMDGRPMADHLPDEFKSPQKDVLFFWNEGWQALEAGSTFRPRPETRFGPEISFGRDMTDAWPSDQVAIIKHAKGGTSLAVEWNPDSGEHYKILLDKVARARKQLEQRGQTLKIEGFVWMQGERDAAIEEAARAYEKNFPEFIRRVRRDLGNPDLPIVFGQIHAPTHYYPHRELVKKAQAKASRSTAHVYMVPTTHLALMDDVHYTAEGVLWLGREFAERMRALLEEHSTE